MKFPKHGHNKKQDKRKEKKEKKKKKKKSYRKPQTTDKIPQTLRSSLVLSLTNLLVKGRHLGSGRPGVVDPISEASKIPKIRTWVDF